MKRFVNVTALSLALFLFTSISTEARALSFDIKTHTLKNGMKILVQEDHSIPNAAMYIFCEIEAIAKKYAPRIDKKTIGQVVF